MAADRAKDGKTSEKSGGEPMGSMHDGSKRRLFAESQHGPEDEMDEFDVISMGGSELLKQAPLLPSGGSKSKGIELPPGVESVERWGKTICTLPKVAARRVTYVDLVKEAESNEDIKGYLAWIKANGHRSVKAADLKDYMAACNYDPTKITAVNYPGTTAVREFAD